MPEYVPSIATLRERAAQLIGRQVGRGELKSMLAAICAAKNAGTPIPPDSTGQTWITESQGIINQADQDALAILVREFAEFVENGGGGGGPPVFEGPNPGAGTEAVLYQGQIIVSGTLPMTYTVDSGTLPTGTTLNAGTGLISGIATVGGNYNFTIRATNSAGTATQAYSVAIVGVAPSFAFSEAFAWGAINNPVFTPDGVTTKPYSAEGPYGLRYPDGYVGTEPITWTVSAGALPDGVTLDPDTGFLTGFPNNPAQVPSGFVNFQFTLRGTNAWGTLGVSMDLQIFEEGYPVP